jgi:hypothetical protein
MSVVRIVGRHGFVEVELARFDQAHNDRCGKRLCKRGDRIWCIRRGRRAHGQVDDPETAGQHQLLRMHYGDRHSRDGERLAQQIAPPLEFLEVVGHSAGCGRHGLRTSRSSDLGQASERGS